MSDTREGIQNIFSRIQELSGQKGKYSALDQYVDELIDQLNAFIEATDGQVEKEEGLHAIQSINDSREDILKVKFYEAESRGKKATRSKERDYDRQMDAAIDMIRSNISSFLK